MKVSHVDNYVLWPSNIYSSIFSGQHYLHISLPILY
jgi:hypothetical protein